MPNIKMKSSDGKIFEVDVAVARCSGTIKTMLEDCGMDECNEAIVPISNVNSAILRKVLQWAQHHKDDVPSTEDVPKYKMVIGPWDAEFLKVDQGTLFELIIAANFLNVKGLLDLTCLAVAKMIEGKTPEEIRKTFNIKDDFTETERYEVRKENEWCVEK